MRRVFIIAEAGVNHNGSLEMAKQLIDVASSAGADAVKFQTFKTENLVTKCADKASYQKETTNSNESQFDMIKKLEIDKAAHLELMEYCKFKNIMFLSSPFDLESIDLLDELGISLFKVPSGEITNYPYLKKIASFNKNVIVSTGMSTLDEVKQAIDVLIDNGTEMEKIKLLHCNTQYPTPMSDVNLLAMKTLEREFELEVGYSDHTLGIEIPIAAVALGAKIIEKHFTLDKNLSGPDHKASLDPRELKEMVQAIRNIQQALGSGDKSPSESEKENMAIARKSIVALKDIKIGEELNESNITAKRPGNGISPMRWNEIIGTMATKDYKEDDLI